MTLHEWFDLGANLEGDAGQVGEQRERADRLLMHALADERNGWISNRNVLQSPLVTAMATGFGEMAVAFRDTAPGTGITYLAALTNWIMYGCPIGEMEAEEVMAAAEEHRENRRHPWGMGKVH
jgi:hypothetical protein